MVPVGPLDSLPQEPRLESSEQLLSERAPSCRSVPATTASCMAWRLGTSFSIPVRHAERLAIDNNHYPYRATLIYAALGDRDRAFEALAQTAEREPQRIPLLLTWPEMAPLRGDPRFSAVEKRFGLPQ